MSAERAGPARAYALVERNDARTLAFEQTGDGTRARRDIQDEGRRTEPEARDHAAAPPRILSEAQDRRPPFVIARDRREKFTGLVVQLCSHRAILTYAH